MPELPEVETVKNGLLMQVQGAAIEHVDVRLAQGKLRTPISDTLEEVMTDATIMDITRRSKYMLWHLNRDQVLLAHLGMSGKFNLYHTPPEVYKKHEHVVWYLRDGRAIAYEDPRRFGILELIEKDALAKNKWLANLGPEPLTRAFNAAYMTAALAKRSQAIKPVLMDAKLVVGVGNIYASEACFRSHIDPQLPASQLAQQPERVAVLVKAIKAVLKEAIASGGSSLRDFMHVEGRAGYFQHHFAVYDRAGEPCSRCKKPIEQIRQAGRSTFFCVKCQK